MTPTLAAQHRAAAGLCDHFPDADLYITTGGSAISVQIPESSGTVADRIAMWSLVSSLVGATHVDKPEVWGSTLRAENGLYNGVPVQSVFAPGVLETSTDDVAAARDVNTANDTVNRQPFGSVA